MTKFELLETYVLEKKKQTQIPAEKPEKEVVPNQCC